MALAKNDPESEALEALARKDLQRTLTVLMQAYGDGLYRHCRQMLGSDDLADDVHQQVFVQAFRDLASFSRRSTFRAWLYGIARHRCLDALKLFRRFRRRFLLVIELPEPGDPAPPADERLAARVEAERLERALAALKPKARAAVLLRFQEGMSYDEMAEVCGEAAGTLQARVARALPLLRRALEKDHG